LGGGFGAFDTFLEFGFEGFLEEFASFDEEKFVHIVEGLSEGGVVGDEVALGEKGFEFGNQQVANSSRIGLHGYTSL
jgi:hypothetical protein